jgi:hypothetical protein
MSEVSQVATPEPIAQEPVVTATQESNETPEAKTFTQEQLNEIVQREKAKEKRKAEEAKKENEYWKKLALEGKEKAAPTVSNEPPRRDQFETYEEFQDAKTEYKIQLRVAEKLAQKEAADREAQAQAERDKVIRSYNSQVKEATKKYSDFEEVVAESGAPITPTMGAELLESPIGAEMTYYLAQHPDESERIANLPAKAQIKEIAKLEVKLSQKESPSKELSKAPAPINPLSGTTIVNDDLPSPKDDIGTWMEKERKRMEKAGRRY